MSKHEDQFEDFMGQVAFDDTPDHTHRDALEKDILRTVLKQQRSHRKQAKARHGLRHASRPRLAAAAVLLAAMPGLVILLHDGNGTAYAIEQTVEAIRRVSIVHIFGTDWDDRQVESWSQVNPQTGLMDYWHVRHIDEGRLMVSTPANTFCYDESTDVVRILDGPSAASIFRLGEFFAGMNRLAENLDGRITYSDVTDGSTTQDLLELKMSAPQLEIRALIDPETKLPVSVNTIRGRRLGIHDTLKHATQIRYDDVPPQGLFDFTIPAGATVTVETVDDPLHHLPLEVLRHCAWLHTETVQNNEIPVNTKLYFVDSQFTLRTGGFLCIRNDSNEVWTGEVSVFNVDRPNMAVFEATSGKKQQVRLVQGRLTSPGRFRLYWNIEQPLPPGQTRYGFYWVNEPSKLHETAEGAGHALKMSNFFGQEAVENFALIAPTEMMVTNLSRQYQSRDVVGEHSVYVWQRRLPKEGISNIVDVSLSRSGAGHTAKYMEANRGKVLVEIPETFELANIAIAISQEGLENPWRVHKQGAYYQRVLEHFLPFKDHPLIEDPDLHYNFTYPFRDNSICYAFDDGQIVHGGLYSYTSRPDLFKRHRTKLEDFARISGFRAFYRDNLPYYQKQITLYRQKVPVRKMWTWLEKQFPARHDCYKIVFSPLIGASHRTCGFQSNGFSETIMFVSGPGESEDISDKVEEGCLSRVVFTEIDHNYVNPVTRAHADRVNKALDDLGQWNAQENYRSAQMTFNEYMTWAVFALYVDDHYEETNAQIILERSMFSTMVQHRKFVRFREFTEQLRRLYRNRQPDQTIPDLYPAILDWMESQ